MFFYTFKSNLNLCLTSEVGIAKKTTCTKKVYMYSLTFMIIINHPFKCAFIVRLDQNDNQIKLNLVPGCLLAHY